MAESREGELKSARVHSNRQPGLRPGPSGGRWGRNWGSGSGRQGSFPGEEDAAPPAVARGGGCAHSSRAFQGPAAWVSGFHVKHRGPKDRRANHRPWKKED